MRPRKSLPWSEWPKADRDLWARLIRKGGLLDEAGPLSHVRPSTQETTLRRYARWLGWLDEVHPAFLRDRPEDRATPERLVDWLASMSSLAPASRHAFLDGTVRVLRLAAPERLWEVQLRVCRSADRQARRSTSTRKVGRVLSSSTLLEAGLELAGPRADAARTPLAAAKRRRDGTMIALLALMPMRLRAFAELELGRSLLISRDCVEIVLSAEMTKNGAPWEALVPESVAPLLRRYIGRVRPWLMARGGAAHNRLWVDRHGAALQPGHLATRIVRATRELLGVDVSPHLFRDAAATSLARLSPQHAGLIRPLLGHQSFGTAERHYIKANMIEAGRSLSAVVDQLRETDR